jgi:hypothetical protein
VVIGATKPVGAADVLVVGVVAATARRLNLRRNMRDVDAAAAPAEVPLSIVTFVKGTAALEEAREAERRYQAMRSSEDDQQAWIDEGLAILNLAIRAYRAGAHDPYVLEVARRDARRVRIGYGSTDDVTAGGWQAAFELPPPLGSRPKRVARLRPSEAIAAVLGGRGRVLEAEDVILRALMDLDHGRTRAAAYQVRAAMSLFLDELGSEAPTGQGRPELGALADTAEEIAAAAALGALDEAQVEALEGVIGAMGDLVDAWRYQPAE